MMDEDDKWYVLPNGIRVLGEQQLRIVDGIDTFTGLPTDTPGNAVQPYWDRIPVDDREGVRQERRAYHERRRVSPYVERDQLMAEMITGNQTLTPKIPPYLVEQHIRERFGLRCWLPGNRNDDQAIASERWRWEVAVSWIAAQTIEGVRDGVAAFHAWQGQTRFDPVRPGQVMSFAEAEEVLRKSLQAGLLRSWRSDINGAEQIPRVAWQSLEWSDEHPPVVLRAEVCRWAWTKQGHEVYAGRDMEQVATAHSSPVSNSRSESECRANLVAMMRSDPDSPLPRDKVWSEHFPHISDRGFKRAWTAAAQEAGTPKWSQPGRRLKSPRS